jgi:nucleotide-binding universal stress UspA family protein
MDYKTLLVHYDSGRTSPARLEIALEVAQKFDAHVACLYALTLVHMPSYAAEAGDILMEAQRRARAEMLESAKRSFDETVRRLGAGNVEWRASARDAVDEVTLHGRYADLIVIGQKNEEWPSGVDKAFEQQVLLAAGRPVLLVPYAFEKRPLGNTVLVAWSATREAARAVSDALPILQRARQVHVVAFNPRRGAGAHGDVPGADIGLFLARHGVKVNVSQQEVPDVDVGNQLLSRAFDLQADLIVMGAYGHSRLQELILGGVTRTLLESMTVPVLMSH